MRKQAHAPSQNLFLRNKKTGIVSPVKYYVKTNRHGSIRMEPWSTVSWYQWNRKGFLAELNKQKLAIAALAQLLGKVITWSGLNAHLTENPRDGRDGFRPTPRPLQ